MRFRVALDGSRLLQGALGVKTQCPSTFGSLRSEALEEVQLNMLAETSPIPNSLFSRGNQNSQNEYFFFHFFSLV